jgi:hypothetical protein
MISSGDVEVVGRAIVLVVLGTSQEFLVVHDPEICILDRVVGVESIRDSMLTVIVFSPSYFNFISYAVTPTSFRTIGLDRRRLSSCIASWIWGRVPLDVGSVGCVVGGIASGIDLIVCWGVSHRIGWSVGRSVGSRVDRLCYFIFASSFFSHRVEGTLATTSLARTLRPTSRIGTCRRSAVSGASFLDLSSCNTDVGLEAPDRWRIFKVV